MKIYIANFAGTVTDAELSALFAPFGAVQQSEVAVDAFTGVSRGFGHVTLDSEDAATKAIATLNGSDWQGLPLTVREAPEEQQRAGSYKVGSGPIQAYRFRKN